MEPKPSPRTQPVNFTDRAQTAISTDDKKSFAGPIFCAILSKRVNSSSVRLSLVISARRDSLVFSNSAVRVVNLPSYSLRLLRNYRIFGDWDP